jgi:hypothetical protein
LFNDLVRYLSGQKYPIESFTQKYLTFALSRDRKATVDVKSF